MNYPLIASATFLFVIGCRTTNLSTVKDLNSQSIEVKKQVLRLMVQDPKAELQPCAVYTAMEFDGEKVSLSNWINFDPSALCRAQPIPQKSRDFEVQLQSRGKCGDIYVGFSGQNSLRLVDRTRSVCDESFPEEYELTETGPNAVTVLWSKDEVVFPQPQEEEVVSEILLPEGIEKVEPCMVYTKMSFTNSSVTLSQHRYFHPAAFCTAIFVPEDRRTYALNKVKEGACGSEYKGSKDNSSLRLNDYRNSTCGNSLPGHFSIIETRNGKTSTLWSKAMPGI